MTAAGLATITDGSDSAHVQDGYFKAAVQASTEQLHDKHGTHQFVVTFTIDSGPQYRMGQIGTIESFPSRNCALW